MYTVTVTTPPPLPLKTSVAWVNFGFALSRPVFPCRAMHNWPC